MKKLIILFTITFFVFSSYAQSSNYEDVVYLKNGSIYRGMIIEQVPNKSLKIQSQDRNVFAVELSDVEKITKEEKPNSFYRNRNFEDRKLEKPELEEPKRERKPERVKYSGFYMNWAWGGGGTPDNGGLTIEMRLGGKIFPKKSVNKKVKVGADISIFGGAMGFPGSGISGMAGLNGGVSIAFKPRKGIIYLTPYIGLNFVRGTEETTYYDNYYGYSYPRTYSYNNISIPVGLKFEYNIKRFVVGAFVEAGGAWSRGRDSWGYRYDNGMGVAGRVGVLVGVKF